MAGVLSAAGHASPRKREYGHWSEVVSSAGKVYYYNRVTEKSQWIKPEGWEKAESVIFPVIDRFQQNREESGFGDNIQSECMSDDDMDVSYGNSPARSSSANSSIEGRPQSSKENREEKIIDEIMEESPIAKYYRAEFVASLHEKFRTDKMRSTQALQSSCAFEEEYATQQTQMYRARALARTAMAKALENQTEVSALSKIQKHLNESRVFFQANFESEMRRILKGPVGNEGMNTTQRCEMKSEDQPGNKFDVYHISEMTPQR